VKKIAQKLAQSIFFVKINAELYTLKKWPQKFLILLYFFKKKLPKVNENSIGENSPNLVTLAETKNCPCRMIVTSAKNIQTQEE
jgi:hypothetical protein